MTATLALSGTMRRGTPPMAAKARVWAAIQSPSVCVPSTITGTVSPAYHEQLVAAHMGLAHRERELGFPASVQLAEAGVAVALRIVLDVLVPEDR